MGCVAQLERARSLAQRALDIRGRKVRAQPGRDLLLVGMGPVSHTRTVGP